MMKNSKPYGLQSGMREELSRSFSFAPRHRTENRIPYIEYRNLSRQISVVNCERVVFMI